MINDKMAISIDHVILVEFSHEFKGWWIRMINGADISCSDDIAKRIVHILKMKSEPMWTIPQDSGANINQLKG